MVVGYEDVVDEMPDHSFGSLSVHKDHAECLLRGVDRGICEDAAGSEELPGTVRE